MYRDANFFEAYKPGLKPKSIPIQNSILFISFDIVNSTQLKNDFDDWPILIDSILQRTLNEFRPYGKFWKNLGDEIIFTRDLSDLHNFKKMDKSLLIDFIQKVYDILTEMNIKIATELASFELTYEIGLKSTIWLAPIEFEESKKVKDKIFNTVIKLHKDDNSQKDYIGIDIDAGFRVTKFTRKNVIALSAELSYFILETLKYLGNKCPHKKGDKFVCSKCEIKEKIANFVYFDLTTLKGVWNNRHYPIFWFSNSNNFDDIFLYDTHFNDPMVLKGKKIIKNHPTKKTCIMECNLRKVLSDTNNLGKIEVIKQYTKENNKPNLFYFPKAEIN